jgi:hypothetical protein
MIARFIIRISLKMESFAQIFLKQAFYPTFKNANKWSNCQTISFLANNIKKAKKQPI